MKKLSIEHIRPFFEAEGCNLLSTEYINSGVKLEYICPKCEQYRKISWNSWQRGIT